MCLAAETWASLRVGQVAAQGVDGEADVDARKEFTEEKVVG